MVDILVYKKKQAKAKNLQYNYKINKLITKHTGCFPRRLNQRESAAHARIPAGLPRRLSEIPWQNSWRWQNRRRRTQTESNGRPV